MKHFRVALAQIAPDLGDLQRNLALQLEYAGQAAERGADVVVFPELSLTGYLLRDCRLDLVQRELDRIRGQRYELSDTPDAQRLDGASLSAADANGKTQG